MKKLENLWLKSFISAASVFIYTSAVAWVMFHSQAIFGKQPSFLMPLFVLLLFIISASVTGLLVLGKPIHLYLNGSKKEALTLLFATLAWLIIFLILVIVFLLL